jgi:uncharacterized alkaline shock family protein YloU
MTDSLDERFTEDYQVAPTPFSDDSRPSLSHEVIATYVADAARGVSGIVDLHTSPWKGFSARMRETHSQGVVVRDAPSGIVDIEIHAQVAWGVHIPDLARKVEEAVRRQVTALLSIDLGTVTLFVDQITGPLEAGVAAEG